MPSLSRSSSDNDVTIRVNSEADNRGFDESAKGLAKVTTAADEAKKGSTDFSKKFEDNLNNVAKVTAVVGVGLTLFAKTSVDKLTDLSKSSKTLATQTGMTAVESSKLIAVFGRMGTDADGLTTNLKIFSKNIADARENIGSTSIEQKKLTNNIQATKIKISELTKEISTNGDKSGKLKNQLEGLNITLKENESKLSSSSNRLTQLGISTVDATGANKDFNQILLEVADKFKEMPDGAEKTALALDLFGRSGAGMIKVLNSGSEGITNLVEQVDKLGLTLTSENIATVDAYVASQKQLADSTQAVSLAVGTLTAPLLTEMNLQLNNVIMSLVGADGPMKDLTVSTLAFGGPIFSAVSGVAAFTANLVSAMPAIKAFGAAVRKPIVMPAIAVGAALAAIGLVWDAYNRMQEAITGAQNAANKSYAATLKTKAAAEAAYASGDIAKGNRLTALHQTQLKRDLQAAQTDPYMRNATQGSGYALTNQLSSGITPTFATGTKSAPGGISIVGENGPEVVDLPAGSRVYNNTDSKRMLSQGNQNTFYIEQVVLATAESTREFFEIQDRNQFDISMNLTGSRGQ